MSVVRLKFNRDTGLFLAGEVVEFHVDRLTVEVRGWLRSPAPGVPARAELVTPAAEYGATSATGARLDKGGL